MGRLRPVTARHGACLDPFPGLPYTTAMITVPKLVLIIIVILAVWYVTRAINRGAAALERHRRHAAGLRGQAARGQGAIEDLVPCRTCGAYVSPGARHCGRPACPRPR